MRVEGCGKRRGTAGLLAGFTITELLVVMAIIGVLAAILFPVVIKAKEGAKTSQCLSNMKQLGSGLYMYLDDHSSRFPAAAPWGAPAYWAKAENGSQKTIQELLWPYVHNGMQISKDGKYPKSSVFCCPSDTGMPSDTGLPADGTMYGVPAGQCVWLNAGCSYEYYASNQVDWQSPSLAVMGWTALSPEVTSDGHVERIGAPLGSIMNTTRKAVMGDLGSWHMGDQVPDGRLAYRNTLFADGHAQRVTGTDHEDARLQQLKCWHGLSEVKDD